MLYDRFKQYPTCYSEKKTGTEFLSPLEIQVQAAVSFFKDNQFCTFLIFDDAGPDPQLV